MNATLTSWHYNASDGRLQNTETGVVVTLRPQVGRLLGVFLAHPNEVIDRETLYREVWDEGTVVDFEAGLAALLRELRKNLTEVGGDPACIETIPRRGYRFRGEPTPETADRGIPLLAMAGAALVAVLIFAVLIGFWFRGEEAAYDPTEMTLAILPFDRFGTGAPEHAEILLPDAMLARLWRTEMDGLILIGRASLRPYTERDDVAVAVSEDLGVNLLMEGAIVSDGQVWTVTARLLHMPAGRVLWSHSVGWEDTDTLPVSEAADRLIRDFQDSFSNISTTFHGSVAGGGAR